MALFKDNLVQLLLAFVLFVTRMNFKKATLYLMWTAVLLGSEECKGNTSVRISCSYPREKEHDIISKCDGVVPQFYRLVKMFPRPKDFT